ncbi:MAG: putative reverse transcriptase, partial [Streblomastix strix]
NSGVVLLLVCYPPTKAELEEQIIEEVSQESLNWINPIFCIPKKEDHKWRKIMDCSILNKELKGEHFLMEDVTTLRELIKEKDWAIKIDLQSAFHHIPVNENLKRYLGFQFQERFYQYRAMCFGIKHAPLIFYKTLRPIIQQIRDKLHLRCIAYCDDLIFLNKNHLELSHQAFQIVQTLQQFGFKISVEKSNLIPTQKFEFLGWEFNTNSNTLKMTLDRKQKMIFTINKWISITLRQKLVKIRWLASVIGKQNFLRLQIFRRGLHMRQLNRCKSKTSIQRGWNSRIKVWRCCLKELYWWRTQISNNKQIRLTFALPDVILRTDASKDQWGGTLTILKTGTTEMLNGPWNSNWKLNSSNQREIAAILLGVRRIKENYSNLNLQALRIESDNAASVYNINRGAAAIALTKMTDRVLEEVEELQMQISARHISGKQNQIANHLSRLAEAGDYQIKDECLPEAFFQMRIKPTKDAV